MSTPRIPIDSGPHGPERWLPFLGWARGYRRSTLVGDIKAGVLSAIIAVPGALGFAQLAGLAPAAGLWTVILSGLVFTAFTTSRHLAVGPTPKIAATVAAGIGAAAVTPQHAAALASTLALLVGALLLLASLLRLGFLTQLISLPIASAYAVGTALTVVVTELGRALGAGEEQTVFFPALLELWRGLPDARAEPFLFGLAIFGLYALLWWWRRKLAPLVTLASSALAVDLLNLHHSGIERGRLLELSESTLAAPILEWGVVMQLLPVALAIATLVFVDSTELARLFAHRHGYRTRSNQELLALGAMNVACGLGGTLPASGAASDSSVAESLEAKTPLSGVVVALCAGAVLLSGPFFPRIPPAALSVLVIAAAVEFVDWRAPLRIWRFDRSEFGLACIALLAVTTLGLVRGLLVAVALSIVRLLWVAATPHTAQLGEHEGVFVDLRLKPEAQPVAGVLVYRVNAALIFPNIERVTRELLALVADESQPTRVVILDLSTVNHLDMTAYETLTRVSAELRARGIRLAAANARGPLRATLARAARGPNALDADFGAGSLREVLRRAL